MNISNIDPVDPRRNKWKQFEFQNIVGYNNKTLHTFGVIFEEHLLNYFKSIIERIYPSLNILEYELPQRDAGYQKTYHSNKKMFERSALPRAVFMYNIDANKESDYKLPNQHSLMRFRSARSIEMLRVEYSGNDHYIDYLKDITMALVGMEQESLATVFFTVLTDNKVDHYELTRKLKMVFSEDMGWTTIYKTEVLDKETGYVTDVPYTSEYHIPRSIIENMKKLLRFKTDEQLAKFLKKYSYNKIIYKIDGATQEYEFFISLYLNIKLKCNAIDDGVYAGDGTNTVFGVKLEFDLRYVDIPVCKMGILGNILNERNPDNFIKEDTGNTVLPIYVRELPNEIKGTTAYNTYEMHYIDDDMKEYYIDEEGNYVDKNTPMSKKILHPTIPFCLTDNGLVNEYIDDMLDEYYLDKDIITTKFNILLTSKKSTVKDPIISNNSMSNIEYNYISKTIIDKESKVGDSVYISVYINKKDFNEWKLEKGYEEIDNLSSKY